MGNRKRWERKRGWEFARVRINGEREGVREGWGPGGEVRPTGRGRESADGALKGEWEE